MPGRAEKLRVRGGPGASTTAAAPGLSAGMASGGKGACMLRTHVLCTHVHVLRTHVQAALLLLLCAPAPRGGALGLVCEVEWGR